MKLYPKTAIKLEVEQQGGRFLKVNFPENDSFGLESWGSPEDPRRIKYSRISDKEVQSLAAYKIYKTTKIFLIKELSVEETSYSLKSGSSPYEKEETGVGCLITYQGEKYISRKSIDEVLEMINCWEPYSLNESDVESSSLKKVP